MRGVGVMSHGVVGVFAHGRTERTKAKVIHSTSGVKLPPYSHSPRDSHRLGFESRF
jgi:hypothetical protein